MSVHIEAKQGQIAETILLPGDPLRAKFIAETFLDDVICYNNVRGMLGFTGTYKGKRISVQGTGMGIPSISIYVNELINEYGVKNLIRVGTAGGIQENVKVRDLVIAMSCHTDSSINKIRFNGKDFAPTASFNLLKTAYNVACEKGFEPKVGSVLTSDSFYNDETAALYTLAAKYKVNALTLLTISDHLISAEETTAQERQNTFTKMMEVALDTAIQL